MKAIAVLVVVVLLSVAVTADALATFTLTYQSSYFGRAVGIRWDKDGNGSFSGGQEVFTAGVGRLKVKITENAQTYFDFFCVDLDTFISGPWVTNRYYVPPDTPPPPPYNLLDAAWVYHTYSTGWSTNADWAAATQLALWEVTHEQYWRTNYNANTWYTSGRFRATVAAGSTLEQRATTILSALVQTSEPPPLVRSISYYEPINAPDGQGLLRDGMEIPEPGSLVLLGVVLIGAAGVALRRKGTPRA